MDIRFWDVVVLVVYFGGITLFGLWFATRNKTTEDYFLGGRNFPSWVIGISLIGTSISSISFLAYPGDAYKTAYLRLIITWTLPFAILLAAYVFVPFFRRGNITSAFQYLESRFGPSTRVYGAVAFIAFQLLRIAQILFLISILVREFIGWPMWACIVAAGIFVAFYTVVGGIEAVIWTDVIQTIILLFGGVAVLGFIVYHLDGGLMQIIREAGESNKFALAEFDPVTQTPEPTSWDFTLQRKTALMMLFVGLTQWLTEYSSNQNVVQRYCASRSTKAARQALWINCFSALAIWAFFMFVGTSLWVYYQNFPTPESQAMLAGEVPAERILPHFVLNVLPAGLGGLVVAAALAAAMSSLDSSINAISTVGIVDVYKRHLVKGRDDIHYLRVARIIAMIAGVFMIGGAWVLYTAEDVKTLQDINTILTSIFAGGLMGLFFLGFFTKVADGRAVGVAIVCTIAYTLYRSLEGLGIAPDTGIDQYYTGMFGHLIMFAVGLIAGAIIFPAPKDRDLTNLTVWTQDGTPVD